MPNTKNTAVIDALTENSLKTRFEDIDQATIDNTKRRILDMIGCGIGGARGTGNPELAGLVKDWGGRKEATILGYGYKGPVRSRGYGKLHFRTHLRPWTLDQYYRRQAVP